MPPGSTFEIGTQIILLQIDRFLRGWILNITPLKYLVLICIGGAYKMRFRVSSQRCSGVQRGLNPKWLLLSQHSRHQYCVAGSANYSGVGLWSLFRTKLNLRLWEIRGIFTESSRRVSRKPGGSRALRRRRLPPRHWHFIMRGVVAALWLETLYVKS